MSREILRNVKLLLLQEGAGFGNADEKTPCKYCNDVILTLI